MKTITRSLKVSRELAATSHKINNVLQLDNEIPVVKKEYLVACMEEEDKVDEANYIAKLASDSST